MALSPVIIEQFPGLDLRADPGNARAAIDLLNVTLGNGRVRTRGGSTSLFAVGGTTPVFLRPYQSGPTLIVADTSGNIYAVSAAGATLGTTTTSNPSVTYSGVAIGTPAASFFYMTSAAATAVMKRWDGAAWTNPAGFPASIRALSIMPTDNRLVICLGAAVGCKVQMSDPGAPETLGANNYVLLVPGDGEEIQAACTFNNQTFVFKETKFFVFYGNSAGPDGGPVFNYRTVDTGIGIHRSPGRPSNQALCVGERGVYFLGSDGIYRTTGGPPVKVSAPLDPFFEGVGQSPFWQSGVFAAGAATPPAMAFVDNRVYCSLPTGTGLTGVTIVYDEILDAWTVWSQWMASMTAYQRSATAGDLHGLVYSTVGVSTVYRSDSTTTDNGAAIVSRYRLPFEDYSSPRRKRLRETILEGIGSPLVQWSRDWGALTAGSTVVLGTSPAIADARQRLAMRGNMFSLQLGAASGAWQVNRIQVNLDDEQSPAAIDT